MFLSRPFLATSLTCALLLGVTLHSPLQAQTTRPELRIGSNGAIVGELQTTLRLLGYYSGEATGNYDEATVIAVYRFQQAAKIPTTGIMDQTTWRTLFPISANSADTTTPATTPPTTTTPITPVTTATPTNRPDAATLPILRESMAGDSVQLLQTRLKTKGFYAGAIDGVFGRQTLLAVIEAQKAFKLDADGIVGTQTWKKLLE